MFINIERDPIDNIVLIKRTRETSVHTLYIDIYTIGEWSELIQRVEDPDTTYRE